MKQYWDTLENHRSGKTNATIENWNISMHMATEHDNNHTAIPVRNPQISKNPITTHTHTLDPNKIPGLSGWVLNPIKQEQNQIFDFEPK